MRALILILLAAGAVSILGCQESGFDERKETARPLKVQHVLGETKVPGQAEEPLTLTVDALDDTLALGVKPVRAAVAGLRLPPYLREPAAGVELMESLRERAGLPAIEAVQADLILGSDAGQGRFYESLSAIAPTVMTEGGSAQWKLNVRLVGEALGRTNDAEQLLSRYDGWVAAARRSIPRGTRVAVARATPAQPGDGSARGGGGRVRFAPRDSFAGTVLADAGLRQVRSARRADVVLLAPAPRASRAGVEDDPARGGAPLLPGGARVIAVDAATWWGPGGILQARAALDDLYRVVPS